MATSPPVTMKLTRTGLLLSNDVFYKLKKKFTIKAVLNPGLGTFRMVRCYRVIKGRSGSLYLEVPRFAGLAHFSRTGQEIQNDITLDTVQPYPELTQCYIEPTDNQEIVMRHVFDKVFTRSRVNRGSAGCILEMKPGSGKTYLSTVIASKLAMKTLVIVPNTYLLEQWQEVLTNAFEDDVQIGLYYGKVKKDGQIVIAIYLSAMKAAKEGYFEFGRGRDKYRVSFTDFISSVGLTVFDESQTYCNDATSNTLFRYYQTPYMLGLSANPRDRPDGLSNVAIWNIGKVVTATKLPGYVDNADLMNQCSTIIKKVKYYGPNEYTKTQLMENGTVSVPLMLNLITEDPYRNMLLAKETYELYKRNLYVFVFSDRLEHLQKLRELILQLAERDNNSQTVESNIVVEGDSQPTEPQNIEPEHEVTRLVGGSSKETIQQCVDTGRIILTTYQYSSVGVSIKKMNALVLSTPRVNGMVQIVGRIYRLGSELKDRIIVDLVDMRTTLKQQMYKRNKAFRINLKIKRQYDEEVRFNEIQL